MVWGREKRGDWGGVLEGFGEEDEQLSVRGDEEVWRWDVELK